MNTATAAVESLAAAVFTTIQIPRINAVWKEQGGKLRGIVRGEPGQRDYLLIQHVGELPQGTWQACRDAAAALDVEGHKDFTLPSRAEAALLYANAKDDHETDDWYWTSEPYGSDGAWVQYFGNGSQHWYGQSLNYRAVAVRRIPI